MARPMFVVLSETARNVSFFLPVEVRRFETTRAGEKGRKNKERSGLEVMAGRLSAKQSKIDRFCFGTAKMRIKRAPKVVMPYYGQEDSDAATSARKGNQIKSFGTPFQ